MNNIIERLWNKNRMVQIEDLKGSLFQDESAGHTFKIYGIDDAGNSVSLSGTPSGIFHRPDNTDVTLTCSVSGGVVSATLPSTCYDVPGRGGITVFLTSDSQKTAIYAAVATVTRTESGTVAPPATQNVVDLINAISAAVATIPASYSDLMADIAPTYSSSSLYAVGQYAWYNGDLKRCIVPITTAESYTAAHWTSAVLGNDISDLKSAFETTTEAFEIGSALTDFTWVQGYIRNNGTEGTASNICRNNSFRKFSEDDFAIRFVIASGFKIRIYEYSSNSTSAFIKIVNEYTENQYDLYYDPTHYYRVTVMKTDETALTPSGVGSIKIYPIKKIDKTMADFCKQLFMPLARTEQKECAILASDIVNGTLNGGVLTDDTNRLRLKWYIKVDDRSALYVKPGSNCSTVYVMYFKSDLTYISYDTVTSETTKYPLTKATTEDVGYVMVVCKNSGGTDISPSQYDATIKLINYNAIIVNVPFEKGALNDGGNRYDGPVSSMEANIRNKYPVAIGENCKGIVLHAISATSPYTMYYRDVNGDHISKVQNITPTVEHNLFYSSIPATARYIDFSIPETGLYDIDIKIITTDNSLPETKRVFTNENGMMVNYFEVDRHRDLYSGMCYMMPPNYSPTGKKVPLILYFGGNTNYPEMGSYFAEGKRPGLGYVRDEGFAVVQIYSWGSYYANKYSYCGYDQPYPVQTCLTCLKKGLEYICDRYNIDSENVHIMSKSMGGIISLYFASKPIWDFKTIGMFSPALDLFSLRGRYQGARKALYEELNMTDDPEHDFWDITMSGETETGVENYYFSERCVNNSWAYNLSKMIQLNPAWLGLVGGTFSQNYQQALSDARAWYANKSATGIYAHSDYKKIAKIPVKIWGAMDDQDVPYLAMPEIVAQLQNAGIQAELRSISSGGHSIFDVSTTHGMSGTTVLGISYSDIPCGWVENVAWIRSNESKATNGAE